MKALAGEHDLGSLPVCYGNPIRDLPALVGKAPLGRGLPADIRGQEIPPRRNVVELEGATAVGLSDFYIVRLLRISWLDWSTNLVDRAIPVLRVRRDRAKVYLRTSSIFDIAANCFHEDLPFNRAGPGGG